MYKLVRPFVFALSAEHSHELTLAALRAGAGKLMPCSIPDCPVEVMGLRFPNPVGLAAGLDKNGDCIDGLAELGFGFIEVGTITPRPQPGNDKPRLFRLPQAQAIINRMGFNNHGADYMAKAISKSRYRGILGINIGKNADTPVEKALDDYLVCQQKLHHLASYMVVNISSPNTPGLRTLQHGDALEQLVQPLRERQDELDQQNGKRVPLVIKIAPDNDIAAMEQMAQVFIKHRIDGVIVGNTTLQRPEVQALPHGDEQGGLSGAPLKPIADQALKNMIQVLDGKIPVIGVGGIISAQDVADKKRLGADLVQIYSGLIYEGPGLVGKAVKGWVDN